MALRKYVPERDRIVIFSDNNEADVAIVYDRTDDALYASSETQEYCIPISDTRSYVGKTGRIYLLGANQDYISDTVRLAALERSIVLRQITQFNKPVEEVTSGLNIQKILLYVLIGVLVLAVIFK